MSSPTDPRTALTRVDLTLMGVPPDCNGQMGAAATTPCADLSIAEKRLARRTCTFRSATARRGAADRLARTQARPPRWPMRETVIGEAGRYPVSTGQWVMT